MAWGFIGGWYWDQKWPGLLFYQGMAGGINNGLEFYQGMVGGLEMAWAFIKGW